MRIMCGIVNRNLPDYGDRLGDAVKPFVDKLHVVENGSDPDKFSKHATIINTESKGATHAVNQLAQACLDEGYDALFLMYNDAWHDDFKGYIDWSIDQFQKDPTIGMTCGYWTNLWDTNGQGNPKQACSVSFFDPISFIVRVDAIKVCQKFNPRLTPLVDGSNFASHFVVLSTSLALYSSGYHIIADPKHTVQELQFYVGNKEQDDMKSLEARGFDDNIWRSVVGPQQIQNYMDNAFPELKHLNIPNKKKRDIIINQICNIWHSKNQK